MRAFILANGQPPSPETAREYARIHDMVIVIDGAANTAVQLGLSPHIICGDFDSVEHLSHVQRVFPTAEIVRTPDQNFGDLEKALLLAIDRGADEITIAAAGNRLSGRGAGRVDHMLANYSLLLRYHNSLSSLKIVDDWSEVRAVSATEGMPGELVLAMEPADRVSLIPVVNGTRVTLTGVKWPLDNTPLSIGTHAISNEAQDHTVRLKVHAGMLFICHLPGGEEKTVNQAYLQTL